MSGDLQRRILDEAHKSQFTIHPGVMKMYQDIKMCWWLGMNKDIAELISKYLVYQNIKIKHQKASSMLQLLEVPKWKWESISMDFVMGLHKTQACFDAI